jgi:hypothetical protein
MVREAEDIPDSALMPWKETDPMKASSALSCEYVELRRLGDDDGDRDGDLCFGPVLLGQLREGELGLVLEIPS